MIDTYLCNKRLLLKQGRDRVARQIHFPLPRSRLISHAALIQPLLSPLASADWLTYGIALLSFSSSPQSPENQTLLPVNLFWFLFGKESTTSFFFYTFLSFEPPESKRCLNLTQHTGCSLYEQRQTFVTALWCVLQWRWKLAIACDLLGFSQTETQMLAFSMVRKCTKEFHSTSAKSTFTTCLWHQSYTRVTYYTPQ